jgi:CTP synthase
MKRDAGPGNVLYVHVTLIPSVGPWSEVKTKPTQHSVMRLREVGIAPDVLVCRVRGELHQEQKEKIALFCDVDSEAVIAAADTDTIYSIPVTFEEEGFADLVTRRLTLPERKADLTEWKTIIERVRHPKEAVRVAVVGKYIQNGDAYLSIAEALHHGGIAHDSRVDLKWLDSEELEEPGCDIPAQFEGCDAVVVCPGFGARGIEGKIQAVRFAREQKLPYLGICLGMQMAVIEYARNVCGLKGANSTEVDEKTPHPVIALMTDQYGVEDKGATMRLGLWPCRLEDGSRARNLYGESLIHERHRHRYEFNNAYREQLGTAGLRFCGVNPEKNLVEIIELPEHPFLVGTQFHPEFRSRPNRAHPLFAGLIRAALKK